MTSVRHEQLAAQLTQRLPHLRRLWKPEMRLVDLHLDSLDLVELLMVVDELYGVRLTANDLTQVTTVGEFCALVASRAAELTVASAGSSRST